MPADLFDYWQAYASIKPFGHQDRILAHLLARLVNVTKADTQDPIDVYDILPMMREEAELMHSAEEQMINRMGKK